jgi:hypothetical protein
VLTDVMSENLRPEIDAVGVLWGGARIGGWAGTFASGSRTATLGMRPSRQAETHTEWAAREFGTESRWTQTVEGTSVAQASIVELSHVELDEQPTLDGVLPAQAASAEARARARILSETLRDEPDHAGGAARPGYRPD